MQLLNDAYKDESQLSKYDLQRLEEKIDDLRFTTYLIHGAWFCFFIWAAYNAAYNIKDMDLDIDIELRKK